MQLKVVYRPREPPTAEQAKQQTDEGKLNQRVYFVDRQEDTYASFFDMVFRDIIGEESAEKHRENFRLRAFNVQYKIMLDTYTNRENETLQ